MLNSEAQTTRVWAIDHYMALVHLTNTQLSDTEGPWIPTMDGILHFAEALVRYVEKGETDATT